MSAWLTVLALRRRPQQRQGRLVVVDTSDHAPWHRPAPSYHSSPPSQGLQLQTAVQLLQHFCVHLLNLQNTIQRPDGHQRLPAHPQHPHRPPAAPSPPPHASTVGVSTRILRTSLLREKTVSGERRTPTSYTVSVRAATRCSTAKSQKQTRPCPATISRRISRAICRQDGSLRPNGRPTLCSS